MLPAGGWPSLLVTFPEIPTIPYCYFKTSAHSILFFLPRLLAFCTDTNQSPKDVIIVNPGCSTTERSVSMDGLSAVASICTLVELSAKLLSTCYQYRKEVKGATKEIQSIIDQLASLKWVLERLEQLENTRPPSQPTTLGQLVGTAGPLHQCEEVLKGLMAKLDPAKRWEWPLRSSGIKNTLESVEILKSTLILALSSDQV